MDIRPCPRCRKLVPNDAVFCRRCGVAMRPQAGRGAVPAPDAERLGGRWASTLATTATAALGVVLALFAVSGPRVAVRDEGERALERALRSERSLWREAQADRRTDPGPFLSSAPALPSVDGQLAAAVDPSRTQPPPLLQGPLVFDCAGRSAAPGHKVTLVGRRLRGATKVLFIGYDRGRVEARFRVWDDHKLFVVVPDLGPRAQLASIVVCTPDGSAATDVPFQYTGR
jgi:hypothetical protein